MDLQPRPLTVDLSRLDGLSERLVARHHENNYAGALRRLNAIRRAGETLRAACLLRCAARDQQSFMKRLSGHCVPGRSMASKASLRTGRATASVLLAIGAAALVGWLVVEFYVAVVTLD
jgi:hypothetical protein